MVTEPGYDEEPQGELPPGSERQQRAIFAFEGDLDLGVKVEALRNPDTAKLVVDRMLRAEARLAERTEELSETQKQCNALDKENAVLKNSRRLSVGLEVAHSVCLAFGIGLVTTAASTAQSIAGAVLTGFAIVLRVVWR